MMTQQECCEGMLGWWGTWVHKLTSISSAIMVKSDGSDHHWSGRRLTIYHSIVSHWTSKLCFFLPFYDVQLYWKLLQKEYICFTLQSSKVTFWTFSVQCLLLKKNGENKYQRYFTSVTYHHAVRCMQWCFTLLHVVTFHHVLTFRHVVMFHHIGIFYHGLVQTGPEVQKNLDNTCTRCTHWSILWNGFHSIAGMQADSHQCGANLQ